MNFDTQLALVWSRATKTENRERKEAREKGDCKRRQRERLKRRQEEKRKGAEEQRQAIFTAASTDIFVEK